MECGSDSHTCLHVGISWRVSKTTLTCVSPPEVVIGLAGRIPWTWEMVPRSLRTIDVMVTSKRPCLEVAQPWFESKFQDLIVV